MNNLIFVAIGGAIGASMRYGTTVFMTAWLGKGFPYATLTVNIVGSFIMGLLFSAVQHGIFPDNQWRLLIGVGLLGALTTFSTFSMDSLLLIQSGDFVKAGLNILLNVCVCLFATFLGTQLGAQIGTQIVALK